MRKEYQPVEEPQPKGPVRESLGSYEELSPNEFNRHKELVVVLLKSHHALNEFTGFQALISISDPQQLQDHIAEFAPGQPIGLVCPNGDCSGRMSIRLSNLGVPVYHLGGGLREWYHSFRCVPAGTA